MSMTYEEARAKLDACISEIAHDAGDGVVTDWQLSVVSVETQDMGTTRTGYRLYSSKMPYHAAYGLASWTVDAIADNYEDDGDDE